MIQHRSEIASLLYVVNDVQNIVWTPSKLIARLGKEIDNPDSVYYWCYKVGAVHLCYAVVIAAAAVTVVAMTSFKKILKNCLSSQYNK